MNRISDMRSALRELVRAYTIHVPFQRGKDRLRVTLEPLIRPKEKTIVTEVPYDQTLEVFCGEYVSDQIYYYGCFERPLVTLLAESLDPGMTFFDVGGHVGLYSVLAAARVGSRGQVFVFEPSRETFDVLSRNAQRARGAPIVCTRAAVSDRAGEVELHHGDKSIRASSTMGKASYTSDSETVPSISLDDFARERGIGHVDAIKMDIEGAERLALMGAASMLDGQDPPGYIQVELDERHTERFGHKTQAVTSLLTRAGYELFELVHGQLTPLALDQPLFAVDGIALRRGTRIAENTLRIASTKR